MLHGQPGTGKTLLAKAVAGEAEVPFFQASGSDFEQVFVGLGASRVRNLFKKAKKQAPCIIFIDELDSVARRRYDKNSHNEQTLNQLLSEMDGFSSDSNIIVIAATNCLDVLDPAILRPGRFDRQIFVPKPDILARESILKIHARNKNFEKDVSMKEIAKKTLDFSGADLRNVLNEAAIYAVKQSKTHISKEDIDEAIARVVIGLKKKSAVITEKDKYRTAIHEAGHAIVSAVLRPDIENLGISITPRGTAGGYNLFSGNDKIYYTKTDFENQIQVSYGGRIAEETFFREFSNGAFSDLEKASEIALSMVTKFAMREELLVIIGHNEDAYNKQISKQRIEVAEQICQSNYESATQIIKKYKKEVKELADLLCEKEALSQEEVNNFIKEHIKTY